MTQIISEFADTAVVQGILNSHPTLAKFAYEMCSNFNVKVAQHKVTTSPQLTLLTNDGLDAGVIYISNAHNRKKGETELVYFYKSDTVDKDKSSTRSDRRTRDSTSISSLIKAIKKNGEVPTSHKIMEGYSRGIAYAFAAVQGSRNQPNFSLNSNAVLALVLSHLKLDTDKVSHHTSEIREAYNQYQRSMENTRSQAQLLSRFAKGVKIVGWINESYYLVGNVGYNIGASEVVLHAPLKRYNSLRDCPDLALDLPIIRAYAEGTPEFNPKHDLGLNFRDTYYEAIDVASGYMNRNSLWIGIPLEHE